MTPEQGRTPLDPQHSTIPFRPDIQGLRAFAVSCVVLFHAGFGPPAGFAGVDIFFVISGYLMTRLLAQELGRSRRIDIIGFYLRRARRLLPALMFVMAATVAACHFVLSPYGPLGNALDSAAASTVFAGNAYFAGHTGGYFDPRSDQMPLLHLWSLAVEEQFYVLWPVVMLILFKLRRWVAHGVWAGMAITSLVCAEILISHGSQQGFFGLPSRWWELSLGAAPVWWSLAPAWRHHAAWMGAVLVALGVAAAPSHFPGVGALLPAAGTAMLLASAGGQETAVHRALASRVLTYLGGISYPLYLWHWPLLALASATIAGPVPAWMRMCLCVGSVALADLTHRLVERRTSRATLPGRRKLALTSVVLALLAVANALHADAEASYRLPPPSDPASLARADQPPLRSECHQRGDQPPSIALTRECAPLGEPIKVAIWGDSLAMAWQPLAWQLAERKHVGAAAFTRDACPPVVGYDNGKPPLESTRCRTFAQQVERAVVGMDTVILAARWPAPVSEQFRQALEATVTETAARVRHVIIIGETPVLPEGVPVCLEKDAMKACEISRHVFIGRSAEMRAVLRGLSSAMPNVTYVEPVDFFCPGMTCGAMGHGLPLYWDQNHVAFRAATLFATLFVDQAAP